MQICLVVWDVRPSDVKMSITPNRTVDVPGCNTLAEIHDRLKGHVDTAWFQRGVAVQQYMIGVPYLGLTIRHVENVALDTNKLVQELVDFLKTPVL